MPSSFLPLLSPDPRPCRLSISSAHPQAPWGQAPPCSRSRSHLLTPNFFPASSRLLSSASLDFEPTWPPAPFLQPLRLLCPLLGTRDAGGGGSRGPDVIAPKFPFTSNDEFIFHSQEFRVRMILPLLCSWCSWDSIYHRLRNLTSWLFHPSRILSPSPSSASSHFHSALPSRSLSFLLLPPPPSPTPTAVPRQ